MTQLLVTGTEVADLPDDQWNLWLSGWEQWLADMLTFLDTAAETFVDPPTLAQPAGRPPLALTARLRRAGALRSHVEDQLRTRVSAQRRWVPPVEPDATAVARTISL